MYEEAWNAMLKRICLVMTLAVAYAAPLVLAAAVGLRIASLTTAGTDPAPSDIPVPESHASAERTLSARSEARPDDAGERLHIVMDESDAPYKDSEYTRILENDLSSTRIAKKDGMKFMPGSYLDEISRTMGKDM